jgi:hypothetical protein
VIALAGGVDGRAKRETVDFAFDADFGAGSPDFGDVKRDTDNDPAESRGDALEGGLEGFGDWFGFRLHGNDTSEEKSKEGTRRGGCPWG